MSYKSGTIEQYKVIQESLEKLQKDVSAELEQVRKDKIAIQSLKESVENLISDYYYLRDENKIILSAPEIIIGNVGRDGAIMAGGSQITLRAESVNIEGVGIDDKSTGSVVTRASVIKNLAVDPGIDGAESVVKGCSSIINMAKSVVLQSESADDMFIYPPSGSELGVNLLSDSVINVNSLVSSDTNKDYLKDISSALSSEKSDLVSQCNSIKSDISDSIDLLNFIVTTDITPATLTPITVLNDNQDLVFAQEEFDATSRVLHEKMGSYFDKASRLAEVNRQIKALDKESSENSRLGSKIKTKDVNTMVSIKAESVGVSSVDGDGNIRTTPSSAVSINARMINLSTQEEKQKQIKDGAITMMSSYIEANTSNPKVSENSSQYPAEGDFRIVSKNITMESVDYKLANNKVEEELLTKGGEITMRAATIKADTTSTDGSNDGMLSLNAKRVEVKSMDVDKDSRKDKSMAKGGAMLLNAEKMYVGGSGSTKDSENSKSLQVVSGEVGLFGSTTVELQQGKAVVQLAGDKLAVSGSSTSIYGKTTMEADVKFSGKASGGSADFKSLDVATVFKGPSISDGMGVAAGGGGGTLNAKMKQEEIAPAPAAKS